MSSEQREKLTKVLNGGDPIGPRRIKVAMAPYRYTVAGGWLKNRTYGNGIRILALAGLGSSAWSTAHAMWSFDENDPQLVELVKEAKRISSVTDPQNKSIYTIAWLKTHVQPFLSRFCADETVVNIGVTAAVYDVLRKME
jgi:hypothetical protein